MHLLFETNDRAEANRIVEALNDKGIRTFLGGENMYSMPGLSIPNVLGVYVLAEKDVGKARRVLKIVLGSRK